MFYFLKFRKVRQLLEQGRILHSKQAMNMRSVRKNIPVLLDIDAKETRANAQKFIEILTQKQDAWVRVKMLVILHRLCIQNPRWSEFILEHPSIQFQGVLITKKATPSHLLTGSKQNSCSVSLHDVEQRKRIQTSHSCAKPSHSKPQIDQEINYENISVYIHLYLVVPYLAYIMKLAINRQLIEEALGFNNLVIQVPDFSLVWKIINTLKAFMPIRTILTKIGRYYLPQHAYIFDFVEAITQDIYMFYGLLEKHLNRAFECYDRLQKHELHHLINLLQQVSELNQSLYQVYYNRYYFQHMKHILPPKWINIGSEDTDTLFRHYRQKFGILQLNAFKRPQNVKLFRKENKNAENGVPKTSQKSTADRPNRGES